MITGYAAVFYRADDPGTEFNLGSGMVERIMPGAFNGALDGDVVGLFNHDPSLLLGRTTSGTLRLKVDKVGLRYEIDPSDTQLSRDVQIMQDRGDLMGSSFTFSRAEEKWTDDGDKRVREIHGLTLHDVSPVTQPAYPATEGRSCRIVSPEGRCVAPTGKILAECRSLFESRQTDAQDVLVRARMVQVLTQTRQSG